MNIWKKNVSELYERSIKEDTENRVSIGSLRTIMLKFDGTIVIVIM